VAEKRTKVVVQGFGSTPLDGSEVPIIESTERWSDVQLEDGSVLRVKPTIFKVTRIDGKWDNDGNPLYAINTNVTMTVASSPEALRKSSDPGHGKVN